MTSECWLWTGYIKENGYGSFRVGSMRDGTRTMAYAHRVAYEQMVGLIPEDREIDHLCRNRACVRPDHLEAVTHRENMRRGLKGVLTTHCPYGHEYTEENTRVQTTRRGRMRGCKECRRRRGREAYWRRKISDRLKGVA